MVPNDEPKLVNIDKISTALHVYYLNLIVNYLNTVVIGIGCSTSKVATIFVGIETLFRLSIFRSMSLRGTHSITYVRRRKFPIPTQSGISPLSL